MSLTKKSEKLIKYFIDDFDKYCVKKTRDVQKSTDTVLKLIYRDINHSVNYIRLIQRRWKRIMKERKNIMKWRMNPMYLQERCIYGRWVSDKVNRLPTIHGMLSEIKNNVSIYQE